MLSNDALTALIDHIDTLLSNDLISRDYAAEIINQHINVSNGVPLDILNPVITDVSTSKIQVKNKFEILDLE